MAAKVRDLRWWIAGLLFLSTFINYVDRQTLSVLAPVIQTELGISEVQYANILTGFLASYTVMYLGSGLLVDRWGARLALSVFIVWWSLANMSHAFVMGAFSLGLMRFLLGMGESGNFMAAFRAVSEWCDRRATADHSRSLILRLEGGFPRHWGYGFRLACVLAFVLSSARQSPAHHRRRTRDRDLWHRGV
jgi:MFS family permease